MWNRRYLWCFFIFWNFFSFIIFCCLCFLSFSFPLTKFCYRIFDELPICSHLCQILVNFTIDFYSWGLEFILNCSLDVRMETRSFFRDRRNIENLLHLIIEENYLIILSNKYAIIVYLDKTTKHVNQLSLLSCTLEIFSVSLVECSCKKVNEHYCYALVDLYSWISEWSYVKIISDSKVY